MNAGSRPLFRIAPTAAGDVRNSISDFAAGTAVADEGMPAEKMVTRCAPGGSGATKSMPATGSSSLICWKPISTSPRVSSAPTGPLSTIRLLARIASVMPSRGNSSVKK